MINNFWYVQCHGSYASGMWCPFETKEEAIAYVKGKIKKAKITFEGIDKYEEYAIKLDVETMGQWDTFYNFSIIQRKDNEILEWSYAE